MNMPNARVDIPKISRMYGIASWAANLSKDIAEPNNISPKNLPAINHFPTLLFSAEAPKDMNMHVQAFPIEMPIVAAANISSSILFPSSYPVGWR